MYINPKIYYQVLQKVLGQSLLKRKSKGGSKRKTKGKKETELGVKVNSVFLLAETKVESAFGSA